MKYLFVVLLLLLAVASLGVRFSQPDLQTDRPVIYWVTDKNPARELQVERFHAWLVSEGHVDENGEPAVQLRLDMGNSEDSKKIIQSISGVGGDLMDTGGPTMRFLQAMGVLVDLTDHAQENGYGLDQTYPALAPDLSIDGRQYRYPANVAARMVWVNPAVFEQLGLEPPPKRWTWDQFEELGIAFRDRANPPGTSPSDRRFLSDKFDSTVMAMTNGIVPLNETLTASALNDPRYVDVMETYKRWVYELNILPSPDDMAAVTAAQGYGGAGLQLFGRSQYGMFEGGRYHLIQIRRFPQLGQLRVVEPPHNELPVTTLQSRAVVLYAGSDRPDLGRLFLEFLASESYNSTIVEDADALPPNPKFTRTDAFERPPQFPNEWGTHEVFRDAAETIAVPGAYSPYVLPSVVNRERSDKFQAFISGRLTAEEAAQASADAIDERIASELQRKPELREAYERDRAMQEKIDALKAEGRPIPASWIKNPFHRYYYAQQGLLLDDSAAPATEAAS
ncbi:MAG: ABC transporter substrate-binding protein [Planctomycetota bacterium]